jgi:hypothetical protein
MYDGKHGLDWSGSGFRQVVGSSKCGNEASSFMQYGELLTSWEPVSIPRRTLLYRVRQLVSYVYNGQIRENAVGVICSCILAYYAWEICYHVIRTNYIRRAMRWLQYFMFSLWHRWRLKSSGMLGHVDWQVLSNDSSVFIFGVLRSTLLWLFEKALQCHLLYIRVFHLVHCNSFSVILTNKCAFLD